MADDGKARRKAERERRLEAALRENLRRRKAQARARAAGHPDAAEPQPSAQDSPGGGQNED